MVKPDETINSTRHVSEVILHHNVEADHRRQVQAQKVVKEMNMSTMQGQEIVVNSSKCQDCGNQAKKDCAYSRCRTCCKNKGFQCQTHVRSTWIPVDRRRQRVLDQQPSPTASDLNLLQGDDIPKRHKHNPYSSEELEFPAAMSSVAIFSCVRVRSMDDTVNQIAYQTSVNIGGHVFSGLLYDQGPDQQSFNNNASRPRGDSSTHTLVHQQHNLSLMMSDGATMPSLPATTAAADHERFFPLPSFRPGMPYFSQYPKP